MTPWNGIERRTKLPNGGQGRRPTDIHCPQHEILWSHHEQEKSEYRALSCGNIAEIKLSLAREVERLEQMDANLKKMAEALESKVEIIKTSLVGKYWFRFTIGAMAAAMLYIAAQNRYSNIDQTSALKEIGGGQKEIIGVINNIENKQIQVIEKVKVFETEIEKLNKRQDILRDQNIKILETIKK